MLWVLGALLAFAVFFGPSLWVQWVLNTYSADRPDFPGTGGELARHLLDEFDLAAITVEEVGKGRDHYDPEAKAVRLSEGHLNGRSVAAVAIAAHEVGHAIQDRDGYRPLRLRLKLARTASYADKVGSLLVWGLSLVGMFAVSPRIIVFGIVAIIVLGLIEVVVHLITLPTEFDASFGKALPVLKAGGYVSEEDLEPIRKLLMAAALTYVSAAAARVLNVVRFLRFLR